MVYGLLVDVAPAMRDCDGRFGWMEFMHASKRRRQSRWGTVPEKQSEMPITISPSSNHQSQDLQTIFDPPFLSSYPS